MPKINTEPMEQKAIRFPPQLVERIDAAARAQGMSRAEFVRLANIEAVESFERIQASESNA